MGQGDKLLAVAMWLGPMMLLLILLSSVLGSIVRRSDQQQGESKPCLWSLYRRYYCVAVR
jgi:hypothetical protein